MRYRFAIDGHGAPLLLAPAVDAPPAPEQEEKAISSSARRRDAVVDAARTLEDLSPAGVEQHARRRWRGDRAITPEDIASFSSDARAQRVHDVADAIDHRLRKSTYGRAGSKQTHISIPRGSISRLLATLDAEGSKQVVDRLRERGWSDKEISRDRFGRMLSKVIE